MVSFQDHDRGKENVRLKKGGAIHKPKSGGDANAKKKLNKDNQEAYRKKLMDEKRALKGGQFFVVQINFADHVQMRAY